MDEDRLFEVFKGQLEKARESQRRNQREPEPRPHRNPDFERIRWQMQIVQLEEDKKKTNAYQVQMRTTITSGQSHTCKTPFDLLKPVILNEMKVPMVHKGRYLVCRTIATPFSTVSANTLIEDLNGNVEELALYNFSCDLDDVRFIPPGTVMIIKEPYLRYESQAQEASLRVDSPSDVIFVDSTDQEFLRRLGAQKWHDSTATKDVNRIREQGNQLFLQKDYENAMRLYDRAIRYDPGNPVLYLNKASNCLRSGYFKLGYESAKFGLDKGGDREKALQRMGLAAYGMRQWQKAIDSFEQLNNEFPNNKDAEKDLKRAKQRLVEEKTGRFDFKAMHIECAMQEKREMDVADYKGAIEIADIPGKGRGVIASKDIKKGTLLAVSKAFASGYQQDAVQPLMSINMISNKADGIANKLQMIRAVDNLRKNPQMTREVYSLYAGDLPLDEEISEGVVDTRRIEKISVFNSFGNNINSEPKKRFLTNMHHDACRLFTLPSYFNHSCLANAHRSFYGNVMVIHAGKDLRKGEEISLAYTNPMNEYSERKKLLSSWGINCTCKLCELDEKDENCGKRKRLIEEFEDHARSKHVMKGKALLEQMNETYSDRNEYRVDLYIMLMIMAKMYEQLDDPESSVKYLEEMVALTDEELELPFAIPQTLLNMAICYSMLNRQDKVQECARKAFKTSLCVDEELFRMCYPVPMHFQL